MSTPTAAQIEALLNFLEEHRDLARGNLRSIEGRVLSHRLWHEICNTLNAMGGCTKTTKQWQKVWTDKKYLAKKAAAAARRSAAATGGGPSTAPSLSQWELKVVEIMGDGFGEPQTSATVPAFIEHVWTDKKYLAKKAAAAAQRSAAATGGGPSTAPSLSQWELKVVEIMGDGFGEPQTSATVPAFIEHATPGPSTEDNDLPIVQLNDPLPEETQEPTTPARDASLTRNLTNSTRRQQRFRRRSASLRTDSSVRDRLFQIEEHRRELEEQRNAELAGIRTAIVELCKLVQLFIERQ